MPMPLAPKAKPSLNFEATVRGEDQPLDVVGLVNRTATLTLA